MPDLRAEHLEIAFGRGAARTLALRGASLTIHTGSVVMVTGHSGSGKTTLLAIMGALLVPDNGDVLVDGSSILSLSERGRAAFRKRHVGFVFQAFRLMDSLTAEENIRLSLSMRGLAGGRRAAQAALDRVGLFEKACLHPRELSGGEKQRVAIARALAHDPVLVFADEPTASLDASNGRKVMEMLAGAARERGRTLVVVSHDRRIERFVDRVVRMEDGIVIEDSR